MERKRKRDPVNKKKETDISSSTIFAICYNLCIFDLAKKSQFDALFRYFI